MAREIEQFAKENAVEVVAARILLEAGFKSSLLGTKHLAEVVALYYKDSCRKHNSMYKEIAVSHSTTSACVERNIRHAITSTTNIKSTKGLNKVLGFTAFEENYPPTNTELTSALVNWIRLQKTRVWD